MQNNQTDSRNPPLETRTLVRAWIWFWYSDTTRILLVLLGGHLLVTGPLLYLIGVPESIFSKALGAVYLFGFLLAGLDNDYSNLRRIGLNEYRKPLRSPRVAQGEMST